MSGVSQLFDAVQAQDIDRVRLLLKQGASPLWPNPLHGHSTALTKALELRSTEILTLLLAHAYNNSNNDINNNSNNRTIAQTIVSQLNFATATRNPALPDNKFNDAPFQSHSNNNGSCCGSSSSCASSNGVTSKQVEVDQDGIPLDSHVHEYSQLTVQQRVERAVAAMRRGEFLVVMDSEDRENEGDLIIAAELVTAEKIAFMINNTSGIICVGTAGSRLDELQLPQMVHKNTESHGTAFTHSVDYKIGTTTGISAADRAITIRALADPAAHADQFTRPGHIFPLRARPGGVLERPGHTETSVDLAILAGLAPAGALCELVNKDGSMARGPSCKRFAHAHGLQWLTIRDLIEYQRTKKAALAVDSVDAFLALPRPSAAVCGPDGCL